MELIDGKNVSQGIRDELKRKIDLLVLKPSLTVVRVGNDAASEIYVKLKRKMCEELGIIFNEIHLEESITQEVLNETIDKLNSDKSVNAILLQSPIPYHLNIIEAFERINPDKDVDGFNPINVGRLEQGQDCYAPCTPTGIMTLLKAYNIDIVGKKCVVVGRSNIVGRPMAQLLLNAHGTVTICHSKTKNLGEITKTADILVVAIGNPRFIKEDMVKEGAVVIDVGINRLTDTKKLIGDVDFNNVKDKCSYITPVPGGVGPMTIVTLMENVLKAYEKQLKS